MPTDYKDIKFLGANEDSRSEDQKKKDYFFEEIVAAAAPVTWEEKPKDRWRRFPDQDQDGSGSCVAQTIKKLALILLWLKEKVMLEFSATSIYQKRSNKPSPGMIGVNAFDIWRDKGITLERLVPSQQMNDAQMDSAKIEQYQEDIAKIFSIGSHVGIAPRDFETVASVIQTTGKGVMVWFYFTYEEWAREIPTVIDSNLSLQSAIRHSVAAVDFFTISGKKYLLIEDSAPFGGWFYHLISEEFFNARNWFTRYSMNFKFQDQTQPQPEPQPIPQPQPQPNPKPQHKFADVMTFGMRNNDVVALQNILKYEGLFPTNVDSTGYYGAVTAKAVYQWQVRHSVASLAELNSLQGRRAGSKTIAKLNELYG